MKHLQVAVGIIRDPARGIFLAQRSSTSHMANKWEFPGGKIEQGETAEQALKRELMEETGIEVLSAQPAGNADHTYDNVRVTLHFFIVEQWDGEPWGREGQQQLGVAQQDLQADEFPQANHQLVGKLVAGEL